MWSRRPRKKKKAKFRGKKGEKRNGIDKKVIASFLGVFVCYSTDFKRYKIRYPWGDVWIIVSRVEFICAIRKS